MELLEQLDVKTRLKIQKKLKKELNERRYEHTLRVENTATLLASHHKAPIGQCAMAALLHDCAKNFKPEKMSKLCEKYHIELSDNELLNNDLIHSKLGAVIAKEHYKIGHPEVLSAIKWHTTGRPDMTLVEKILFVADYIEPGRKNHGRLDEIRPLANQDLDLALMMILEDKINYLKSKEKQIDPITFETYHFYKDLKRA